MPPNAAKSSGKPKKRKLVKAGNIEKTTLLSSPDEVRDTDYIVSNAKFFADLAIEAHFKRTPPYILFEDHLRPISLAPRDVAGIIAAAGMPLRGHTHESHSFETPKGDKWEICSGYGFGKRACGTFSKYKFDRSGDLLRTSVHSIGERVINVRDVRIVRSKSKRRISDEEALAAMSAVLDSFDPLRFSLTWDASVNVLVQLARLRHGARALAEDLRHPHARILRRIWSHAAEALCEQLVRDILKLEKILGRSKAAKARVTLMGPMTSAFNILYGIPAADAPTAFTKFGKAFFSTVGCRCDLKTVKSAFRAWRKGPSTKMKKP